jgi:hypothetical protein
MSATNRQNRLLVSEDWKKIYQSYRNADFKSYDFENLRRVMVDYLRENYPEDFNDYIESSEYLALIDMIAFLGQSIAFRVDLNARDNFLELAERRESVLRLSRTIGYNAKRNLAANGLLKFQSVSTTQDIIDSNGRNLRGQEIVWNDNANSNWYEQFIKVINAALPATSQFGNPDNKAVIYNIPTEQYRLQTLNTSIPVYTFKKVVDGRTMNFEVVSTIIENGIDIVEDPPQAGKSLAFLYRDDGRGAASPSSGFFTHFRQGTLNTGTFSISNPSTNEIIDIDSDGINNTDVWLYKLNSRGVESEFWAKVPSFEGNNVIYNSLKKNIRNIYSVITRTNDRISVAFSDGTFGTLPLGNFRIYYRLSNGLRYTINSKDIKNVVVDFQYISNTGQSEVLTITMGLQTSVNNSSPFETNEQIKFNAPSTYYTQNRMITAEDYNISPLSVNQEIIKIKAINRSSSGISRYFDLNDPTGKYSSTNLFGDDGVLYKQTYEDSFRFNYINKTDIESVIYNQVFNFIKDTNLRNFYYDNYGKTVVIYADLTWNQVTQDTNQCTGYFKDINQTIISTINNDLKNIEPGALIKFQAKTGFYFDRSNENALVSIPNLGIPVGGSTYIWAKVVSVTNNGLGSNIDNPTGILANGNGAITLNIQIPSYSRLINIIPRWRTTLDTATITNISDLVFANKPFGLRYDLSSKNWKIVFESNLNIIDNFNIGKTGDESNQKLDSSWLLLFTTDTEFYTVTARKLKYIFESDKQIRFYHDSNNKIYDSRSNMVVKDQIRILNINTNPASLNQITPFTYNLDWEICKEFLGIDGYVDTKKIEITFNDSNDDGVVDDPNIFDVIVDPSTDPSRFIILEKYEISNGQIDYRYVKNKIGNNKNIVEIRSNIGSVIDKIADQYYYFIDTNTVQQWNSVKGKFIASLNYKVFQGRSDLKFQYIHSADYESRIDPGQINIIDLYILTKQYDLDFRRWLIGKLDSEPLPLSSDQLNLTLSKELNSIKAMSDEVIYHPVKYKVLFGSNASPNLRASFKVIKNPEQIISDNEIRTNVLSAIIEFFSVENWDFGDSFYFSELVTYVMNKTTPYLVNIVIVPRQPDLHFGSLFEIKAESDQIFINGATTDDIEVISAITASNISADGSISVSNTVVSQQNISSSTGSY